MARGELIGCFALTEPQGGSDPAAMRRRARRDGDDWVITGTKRWIGLAGVADVAVVWARTDDGVRGFLVPTRHPGLHRHPIDGKLSMRASVQCDIVLDDVRVPASAQLPGRERPLRPVLLPQRGALRHRLGRDGRGARAASRSPSSARTTREVFGAPIGASQLIAAEARRHAASSTRRAMLLALHLGRLKERGAHHARRRSASAS